MANQYNLTITKNNSPATGSDSEYTTISTNNADELKRILNLAGLENVPANPPMVATSAIPPVTSHLISADDPEDEISDYKDFDRMPIHNKIDYIGDDIENNEDEMIEDAEFDFGSDKPNRMQQTVDSSYGSKQSSNYPLRVTNRYGDNAFDESVNEMLSVFPNTNVLVEGYTISELVEDFLLEYKAKLGTGKRFKNVVETLKSKGMKNPNALAAWLGRKVQESKSSDKIVKSKKQEAISYAAKVQNDSLKKWRKGAALNESEKEKLNEICHLVENHNEAFIESIVKIKSDMIQHLNEQEITQLASVFVNLLLSESDNKFNALQSMFKSLNNKEVENLYNDYLDESRFNTSVYYRKHGVQPNEVSGSKRWGVMIGETVQHFDGPWDEIKFAIKKFADSEGYIGEIKVLS